MPKSILAGRVFFHAVLTGQGLLDRALLTLQELSLGKRRDVKSDLSSIPCHAAIGNACAHESGWYPIRHWPARRHAEVNQAARLDMRRLQREGYLSGDHAMMWWWSNGAAATLATTPHSATGSNERFDNGAIS